MNQAATSFLEAQKASALNPLGSHQARSRGMAISLSKKDAASALAIAQEIEAKTDVASCISGFHPDSCLRLAHWLRDWRLAL